MNKRILYQSILKVIEDEDHELASLTGQGIFYAPELYTAFILGKRIKKKESEIFNTSVEWLREVDLKNGGPTDIIFESSDWGYAIELKIRSTLNAYIADINKLIALEGRYSKYFLALVDTFENDKITDGRIVGLEHQFPQLRRIADFNSFPTEQTRYQKQVFCTIAMWEVPT